MQVDFFDIENKFEAQKMALPWPMKFVAYNLRGDTVRIYYVAMPKATEQHGTFYCVDSEQVLPETFPAQWLATLFPRISDTAAPDDAVHLFFELPVNKPKKPRAVSPSGGQKQTGENGKGGASNDS